MTQAHSYDTLVLSGGGVGGIATMGCIDVLQRHGVLDGVSTVVGTSVGSLVGALVCMGVHMKTAFEAFVQMDRKALASVQLQCMLSDFGLDDGKGLEKLIATFIPPSMTFEQLKTDYGKALVVSATCVTDSERVLFGPHSTPAMSVALAVRISCSIPLVFAAVRHQGKLYVDGSLTSNFALDCSTGDRTLGINLKTYGGGGAATLAGFLDGLVRATLQHVERTQRKPSRTSVITLQTGVAPTNIFTISDVELAGLYELGTACGEEHVKKTL
jgi:predicted acylesterase/phospholipase RssA